MKLGRTSVMVLVGLMALSGVTEVLAVRDRQARRQLRAIQRGDSGAYAIEDGRVEDDMTVGDDLTVGGDVSVGGDMAVAGSLEVVDEFSALWTVDDPATRTVGAAATITMDQSTIYIQATGATPTATITLGAAPGQGYNVTLVNISTSEVVYVGYVTNNYGQVLSKNPAGVTNMQYEASTFWSAASNRWYER